MTPLTIGNTEQLKEALEDMGFEQPEGRPGVYVFTKGVLRLTVLTSYRDITVLVDVSRWGDPPFKHTFKKRWGEAHAFITATLEQHTCD